MQQEKKYSRTCIKRHHMKQSPSIKRLFFKVVEITSLNYRNFDLSQAVTSIKRSRTPTSQRAISVIITVNPCERFYLPFVQHCGTPNVPRPHCTGITSIVYPTRWRHQGHTIWGLCIVHTEDPRTVASSLIEEDAKKEELVSRLPAK